MAPFQNNLTNLADKQKVSEVTASNYMSRPVIKFTARSKIKEAIGELLTREISGAPVVDEHNRLIGIISEHDLLIQAATENMDAPIRFSENVVSITTKTTLMEIIVIFYKHRMKRVPVLNDNKEVVGIVARRDILRKLFESA